MTKYAVLVLSILLVGCHKPAPAPVAFHDDMVMEVIRDCGASYDHRCEYWQYPREVRFHRAFKFVNICTDGAQARCASLEQVVNFIDSAAAARP